MPLLSLLKCLLYLGPDVLSCSNAHRTSLDLMDMYANSIESMEGIILGHEATRYIQELIYAHYCVKWVVLIYLLKQRNPATVCLYKCGEWMAMAPLIRIICVCVSKWCVCVCVLSAFCGSLYVKDTAYIGICVFQSWNHTTKATSIYIFFIRFFLFKIDKINPSFQISIITLNNVSPISNTKLKLPRICKFYPPKEATRKIKLLLIKLYIIRSLFVFKI